jgi:DNA-binding transcriptional MerR regulator
MPKRSYTQTRFRVVHNVNYKQENVSNMNLRKILRQAGYSNKEIRQMWKEDRILLEPVSLDKKVREVFRVVVLDEVKEKKAPKNEELTEVDRFGDLEIE